jgi:hypothetical protein
LRPLISSPAERIVGAPERWAPPRSPETAFWKIDREQSPACFSSRLPGPTVLV